MRSASSRRQQPRAGNAARRTERQQFYLVMEDRCPASGNRGRDGDARSLAHPPLNDRKTLAEVPSAVLPPRCNSMGQRAPEDDSRER